MEKSSRRRSAAVVAALVFTLVLVWLGGVYALSKLSSATDWVKHTDEVRVAIAGLRSTVLTAETGLRGYAIAGEPVFLEPYDRALARWRGQVDHLRALTVDNPEQQQRLAELEVRIGRRFELLAGARSQFDDGRRGAELMPNLLAGNRAMDDVRESFDLMEREEATLGAKRQEAAARRWRSTMLLFLVGGLAFLLAVAAALLQRYEADARRRRAEEVSQTRELFQIVLQGVDIGITVQSPDGKLVYANDAAARTLGYPSPDALLAAPLRDVMSRFDVFHFDGTPFPLEQLPSRAALEGRTSAEHQIRFRIRGSHEERWSRVSSVPVHDADGGVVYAINFFREVTEETREERQRAFLLRAVDELNASLDYEKTLAAVVRLAVPVLADWCSVDLVEGDRTRRVAIAHIDPQKIALVEELERRYPSDPNAPTGVPQIIRSGKPEMMADIPQALLRAAARDEEHRALIERLELHSYLGVPLQVRGTTIGAVTFAMAESERRHTEKDLEFAQALADRAALAIENARLMRVETQRRREAEDASRFAETFIGILGHDLRNPLNAVSMAASLLKRKGVGEPKTVARILSSAERMANMVTQLLDLTRSRLAGGIVVDRKPADLSAVISGVVDELRLARPEREIRWEGGSSGCDLLDPDRMAQVASNLIGNAVEHGEPGRPVTVRLTTRGNQRVLEVHNHGAPIPPSLETVIFDPYRRAAVRAARSRGLGLGLFISQQIVQAHGGSIAVHSTAAEGTTFTVTLPHAAQEAVAHQEHP